jgi:cytochrome c oxidase subunit 4
VEEEVEEPLVSPTTYWLVFVVLIALTLLTVATSFLELGPWHTEVGLAFAMVKASLVALIFMHLIHAGRLTWLVAGAGVFWLGILLGLTLTDYLTRHWQAY